MIKSMTAYGRAESLGEKKKIQVEMKSVNNRYFDCTVKIPRLYVCLEEKIKAYVQSKGISRGKLDIYVNIDVLQSEGVSVKLDGAYAGSYISALRELRDRFGLSDDISVMSVARNPEIFNVDRPDEDMESEWLEIKKVLDEAAGNFIAMRCAEGERLKADLLAKKEHLCELAEQVKSFADEAVGNYREKLQARLEQTLAGLDITIDPQRVLTECAIFADKVAVDEELVRLSSHFKAYSDIFGSDEPIGRKLDFLVQEINREINTIGSKANNSDMARLVIEMKCEVEKIREQIQNIE